MDNNDNLLIQSDETKSISNMQDENWPVQCQSCRKFETCKEFAKPPVNESCPNYWCIEGEVEGEPNSNPEGSEGMVEGKSSETIVDGIHMDGYDPKMIDVEYYSRLRWLSNLCLFAGIWTMLGGLVSFINSGDNSPLVRWLTLLLSVFFLVLCIYSYKAIRKRKPSAIFYARFIMVVCLLSWIELLVSGGFEFTGSNIIFGIGTLIYCSLGLYWTFTDAEIKDVFPKKYRKISWKDYLFCFLYVLVPFIFIGAILLLSQLKAPSVLVKIAEEVNKECPIDAGFGMLTSVNYENKAFTYNYLVNESMVDLKTLKKNKDEYILLMIKREAMEEDSFIEDIVRADANYKVEFMGNQSGNTFSVVYDTQTLIDCLNNSVDDDVLTRLQMDVEMQRLILPMFFDENTTFSDVYIDNGVLHYVFDYKNLEEGDLDFEYSKECYLLDRQLSSEEESDMMTDLVALGYDFECDYKINGKYVGSYSISSSELDYAMTHVIMELELYNRYLDATVANVNRKELPMEVDQGLTIESLEVNEDYLIYNYDVDEKFVRLDVIKENKEELKASLLEFDLETTVGMLAVAAEKGISYHFIGNRSKKTVVFDCPYKEIKPLKKY